MGLNTRLILAIALTLVTWQPARSQQIVVGGKNFTEQQIVAELTTQLLRAHGFAVDKRTGLGSVPLRHAQESGSIDIYWEYTGTSLIAFNGVTDKLDADRTYARVKQLDAAKGLIWLSPSRVNNSYALAMRRADAAARGIKSLSDLAAKIRSGRKFRFGCNAEFNSRPDGLTPMQRAYGFEFGQDNVLRMDTSLVYQSLRDSQVDVGLVFATDGRIPAFDFVLLADDKGFFPTYSLAPVARKPVLDANPKLGPTLEALSASLDGDRMARLNAAVDIERKGIEEVAAAFLRQHSLR